MKKMDRQLKRLISFNEHNAIEAPLFSWRTREDVYPNKFHNCILNINFGEFKKGTKIPLIDIDLQNRTISLYKDFGMNKRLGEFRIDYSIRPMKLTKKEYRELIAIFKKKGKIKTLEIYRQGDLRDWATNKQWYSAMKKAGVD